MQTEKVLDVHHWTDKVFSFKTTRSNALRFENGQFVMIGLKINNKPLLRAYSIASANYEDYLEFVSIKVPNGALTSRLQHIRPGDTIIVGNKPTGTLVKDHVLPGRHLYMLSTGTGIAPFLSLVKDFDLYDRYEKIILTHTTRTILELTYKEFLTNELPNNEYFGDVVKEKLLYYPTVTREPFKNSGRITDLICSGKVFADLGLPPLDRNMDRVMICGNPSMVKELTNYFNSDGWKMGNNGHAGEFVIEKAFV